VRAVSWCFAIFAAKATLRRNSITFSSQLITDSHLVSERGRATHQCDLSVAHIDEGTTVFLGIIHS
jgi:hypothetical protein